MLGREYPSFPAFLVERKPSLAELDERNRHLMDPYYARLLDIYNSLPETFNVSDRWRQAYRQIQEEHGTYREPGLPPSFDPPAQTPQEFASQYAEAMIHMMSTQATHLELPKNFMEKWRKAEERARKEG